MNLNRVLVVGDKLYGYCGGWFGRDVSWEEKVVEAVGRDWVVVRDYYGRPWYAEGGGEKWPRPWDIDEWKDPKEDPSR